VDDQPLVDLETAVDDPPAAAETLTFVEPLRTVTVAEFCAVLV